jgi:hypothetical protein
MRTAILCPMPAVPRFAFSQARLAIRTLVLLALWVAVPVYAQISVPTFGTRGGVPEALVESFMPGFRLAVADATGLEVRSGELITAGIAGSLEPEFALLIAELDNARFAISGEIARIAAAGGEPYAVNLIVVDAERSRATDLISQPLDPNAIGQAVTDLAAAVAAFTSAVVDLERGSAGLFVSSEPGDAQVFVEGVALGRTSRLDVAMLAPGRYQLEVRKEGFLPEVRMVDLRADDTAFVHVILTAISGGSIQISATPRAAVYLDGIGVGATPVTVPALPGTHRVTLERDGFLPETVDVLVRNYRVSRVETTLVPAAEPLVFWDERREVLVFVDGVFQPGAYAENLQPGLRTFELRSGGERRSYLRAVPTDGAYRLDLETGELVPLHP